MEGCERKLKRLYPKYKQLQNENTWLKKAYKLATSIIFRELQKEQMATLEQAVEHLKAANKEIEL